jgi:hypothetical protein
MRRVCLALFAASLAVAFAGCAKPKSRAEKLTVMGRSEALAHDADAVYWLAFDPAASKLDLVSLKKQTGAKATLASVPAAHEWLSDQLAVDATSLYFFARDAKEETLWAVAKTGGAPIPVAPAQHGASGSVATDGERVYWVAEGEVRAAPVHGGPAVTLVRGQTGARDVLVDGSSVYWDHGFDLSSAPKAGGAPTRLTRIGGRILHLAEDDKTVYFSTMSGPSDPAALCQVDKAGGQVRILWTGPWIGAFGLDASDVLFLDYRAPDGNLVNREHIGRLAAGAGGPPTVIDDIAEGESFQQLAVDRDKLYAVVGPGTANELKTLPKGR